MRRAVVLIATAAAVAAAQPPGPPPAKVALGEVTEGVLAPSTVHPGTVYFKEVSRVATEVGGKIVEVSFEEGQHLTQGDPLTRQDDVLMRSELMAARATAEQNEALLEQETVRLDRAKLLMKDEVTTPQEFDDIRFTVESLRHRLDASRATITRLEEELAKKITRAPFDGVVLSRETELGEWKQDGDVIAVYARDDVHDVIVNLPQAQLPYVTAGTPVEVTVQDKTFPGEIVAIIPRGDVATRTFPVKVRAIGQDWLFEAMSADVRVPQGEPVATLMVPRDAVLTNDGRSTVFVVQDGGASQVPVNVLGYNGLLAGVDASGLTVGDQIVVKGHERLRPGQPIEVTP